MNRNISLEKIEEDKISFEANPSRADERERWQQENLDPMRNTLWASLNLISWDKIPF